MARIREETHCEEAWNLCTDDNDDNRGRRKDRTKRRKEKKKTKKKIILKIRNERAERKTDEYTKL